MFERLLDNGFQVEVHSHARAILSVDFPDAVVELEEAIAGLSIPVEEIVGSGGGETQGTQRLRRSLADRGWLKMNFIVEKRINGVAREAISHEIDHVKAFDAGMVAAEIEWNNKDPFYDRDLENFKRLHADGANYASATNSNKKHYKSTYNQYLIWFRRSVAVPPVGSGSFAPFFRTLR